jgi:hypothetical protein
MTPLGISASALHDGCRTRRLPRQLKMRAWSIRSSSTLCAHLLLHSLMAARPDLLGHDQAWSSHWEAPTFGSGAGPLPSPFVEESARQSSKWARRGLVGAALASNWAHRRRRRAKDSPGRPTRYFSRKSPPDWKEPLRRPAGSLFSEVRNVVPAKSSNRDHPAGHLGCQRQARYAAPGASLPNIRKLRLRDSMPANAIPPAWRRHPQIWSANHRVCIPTIPTGCQTIRLLREVKVRA